MTAPAPRAALLTVFLVVFIDLLGFGIVLPLLPRYANTYLGAFTDTGKGVVLGLLYCSFSLMQFVFSPAWGRVSDRIGRRPVLLVSLAGSVAFYGLFAVASTLPAEQAPLALVLLMLSRVGAGIAGASVSTAAAVIADCTPPEKRAKAMGLIGAAFGIGFTFGPLIAYAGLKLFPGERWAPGAVASAMSGVALLVAFLMFKETKAATGTAGTARELFSVSRTVGVLKNPLIGPVVLIYFLVVFGFANFEGTLSVFTESAFGLTDDDNFLVFAFVGFVLIVAQGGLYRRFAGRMSEARLLAFGLGFMLFGLAGLGAVAYYAYVLRNTSVVQGLGTYFYISLAAAVTGFAFANPSVSALVSRRADPARQGEYQGVAQSVAALARILGPFAGLVVFQWHPSRVLPFALAAALIVAAVFVLPAVTQKGERPA